MVRWRLAVIAVAAVAGSWPAPAAAYEFELMSRTIAQGDRLRSLRFATGDLLLNRRRFTQTLALHVWDIGRPHREWWRLYDPDPHEERGPRISFETYLRLDHDFGDYLGGDVTREGRSVSALDLVPELEAGSLQVDVLYAFVAVEDLLDGAVDLYIGRQLGIDALDWYAMDGLTARYTSPLRVAVEGFAGLVVREASPVGWPTREPDGTSGGECQEYVEGSVPGSGAWRPIDLGRPGEESPFRNDLDFCPQREEPMPTFGGAVALAGIDRVDARLSYRRAVSPSPDIIGPTDRFDQPDLGYYPNEVGQAPSFGTNQERLALETRATLELPRLRAQVTPYAAARYSLLHGLVDEAHAGVRLERGAHAVEPELYYSFPTFDGDSIFNVFSAQPYVDTRISYELAPRGRAWRALARGWARRFRVEDRGRAADGADVETGVLAGGGQIGLRWLITRDRVARLDLFHEDGHGGRRTGGFVHARWSLSRRFILGSQVSVVDFEEDLRPVLDATVLGLQLGGTYRIHDEIAVSLVVEENAGAIYRSQLAVLAVLDMAFRPEL